MTVTVTAPVSATTAATIHSSTNASYTYNSTLSPFYNGNEPYYDQPTGYVYFYSGYAFYTVLVFLFFIVMPIAIIMSAMQRNRRENERRLILQRQRARREMEISVNNNTNMGNGSVCLEVDNNDVTILPKGMDLPPSYDELNICNKDGNLGASTLTITTDLGCSNPNLVSAATLNEPPPDYQGAINIVETPATATTISTTTVVSVMPRI